MQIARIQVEDFLSQDLASPILDVRSPGEYQIGHIPSAASFPLFTDNEREIIGTLYKQEGKQKAVKKGLEFVGPRLNELITRAESFQSTTLFIYCWRGGMRSESVAWLLSQYGFKVSLLHNGYKSYRNHIIDFFNQKLPLNVITGYTGSKKTAFLYMLKNKGEQIIDLEGLAQHQGSAFGNKKSSNQPSTEQFQNYVFEEFNKLSLARPIWIEDECMNIGRVNLIENLHRQMGQSPHYFLDVKKSQRVDFLLKDYKSLTNEQLIASTNAIRKKLGEENATKAIEYINSGELKEAAEIILRYYDSYYQKSRSRKEHLIKFHYRIDMEDLEELAFEIVKEISNCSII